MKSAHQMSSASKAVKSAPLSDAQIVWPEEDYSAFYKQHLYLAVMDDFAAYSGGIHKYADHIIRKLLIAIKRGQIQDFQTGWIESADDSAHPFHGRNLRNFIAGKDSAYAIWAVLDLYMKIEQPLIAKGFELEGYLERLGLVVSDFINNKAENRNLTPIEGLFSAGKQDDLALYLHIERLEGRRFSIAHLIHAIEDGKEPETIIANDGTELRNERMKVDKGVLIPQSDNYLLMVRDTITTDVSFGFIKPDGGDICFHRILLDGSTETHILHLDENPKVQQLVKAASLIDGGI